MVCTDRQLAQSQIVEGFSTRAGVVKAIRPFSGDPSGANLMDYLNREVFPALKAGREKLNEVFLNVADQAPSANPLNYKFSTNTANADPTTGRIRLNQAVQNTATVIRISETNAKLVSAFAWLDVMQGSSTLPIGVVTLADSANPGRFIRFDLDSMTDQGAYWDLGVTPTESSHPNPFVEGESVTIGFIPGVATGPIAINSTVGGVGIRAVSAGTQVLTAGTLSFANSNNISWGLTGSTLTAQPFLLVSDFASSVNATRLFISAFGGGTQNVDLFLSTGASGASVFGRASIGLSAGSNLLASGLSFQNSNGLSFGNSGASITGNYSGPRAVSALNYGGSITAGTLVFSNDTLYTALSSRVLVQNVLFSLNGSSIQATALAGFGGGAGLFVASAVSLINTNGAVWSLAASDDGVLGRIIRASLDYAAPRAVTAGTQSMTAGTLVFSNSNNFSWGMSGSSQITGQPFFNVTGANGSSVNATVLAFTTGVNNVGFAVSTNASGATVRAAASINVSAGTGTAAVSQLSFVNGSGVTWALANGGSSISASVNDQSVGLVSHVGGNQVSAVTRLAFSNASNVTWSLSTAAGAATVIASVAAGGGGGIALSASSQSVSTGTVVLSNQTNLDGGFEQSYLSANVVFGMSNSSQVTAKAFMNVSAPGSQVAVTRIQFSNANGVTFGNSATIDNADGGRWAIITASVAAAGAGPDMSYFPGWVDRDWGNNVFNIPGSSSCSIWPLHGCGLPFPGNMTIGTLDFLVSGNSGSSTQFTGSWGLTFRGALYTKVNSTQISRINSFSFATSSTTINSTLSASRNNSFFGERWMTIHSSLWSAQPVLSAGVPYWMGLCVSTAGSSLIGTQKVNNVFAFATPRGTVGAAQSTNRNQVIPFMGAIAGTTPPVSVGTASFATAYTLFQVIPVLQLRTDIVVG